MSHFGEQSKFEIKPLVEQMPFESTAVRSFFSRWCKVNDSITPKFVTREQWENLGDDVLRKNKSGTRTLFIPKDLHLWEMVGITERVDHDTFSSQPFISVENREQIHALGKIFQNAGVYIAQRLEFVSEGRNIAGALAEEFYAYGEALISGEKSGEGAHAEIIRTLHLTRDETEEVDRWLAGESLYASRRTRVEKHEEMDSEGTQTLLEQERQKTLAQFFRVTEKAFELQRKDLKNSSHLKPWQSDAPIHSAFLARIEGGMRKKIETPKRELVGTMFRRGMEFLQKHMRVDALREEIRKEVLGWEGGEKTLREALHIDQLEEELTWVRTCGSVESIAKKEHEIIQDINQAIIMYEHQGVNSPSEMIVRQRFNCLGGSLLAGSLLNQVGINYLVVDVPEHSFLLVMRSDGAIEWRDMINSSKGEILNDLMFQSTGEIKAPVTVKDLLAFGEHPKGEGLMLTMKSSVWKDRLWWMEGNKRGTITVFGSEYGQKVQVLYNLGILLRELGHEKEAVEAYKEALSLNPRLASLYHNLGISLSILGKDDEAIDAYRMAIKLDPEDFSNYHGLGNSFLELERNEEAVEVYREAIKLAPHQAGPYSGLGSALRNLHRNEEAIKAFRQFIARADRYADRELIETIREEIRSLQATK